MAAIEVKELARTYRSRTGIFLRKRKEVEALRGISFEVAEGELFGLLGPNGAGKTTTIKILTTLLLPSSGSARLLGFDPASEPGEIRRRIGHVFGGDRGLYDRLSALDNLKYFADLYRVPVREKRRRIAELLALVDLTGREKERVETYSRGMRQRSVSVRATTGTSTGAPASPSSRARRGSPGSRKPWRSSARSSRARRSRSRATTTASTSCAFRNPCSTRRS